MSALPTSTNATATPIALTPSEAIGASVKTATPVTDTRVLVSSIPKSSIVRQSIKFYLKSHLNFIAICESPCLNGGKCISPGVCSCRRGYQGANCEQDLDECAADLHGCHHTSTCVNMPGWYYCRCKPGYRSILHDGTLGTTCQGKSTMIKYTHT